MLVLREGLTLETLKHKIKGIISDVDGVLTDGRIVLDEDGRQHTCFHAFDGYGIMNIVKAKIPLAIVSGRSNQAAYHRVHRLGVTDIHLGIADKTDVLAMLCKKFQIPTEGWLSIGDDVNDIGLFKNVGVGCTVPNAHPRTREHAMVQTERMGGHGAFRELSDWVLDL